MRGEEDVQDVAAGLRGEVEQSQATAPITALLIPADGAVCRDMPGGSAGQITQGEDDEVAMRGPGGQCSEAASVRGIRLGEEDQGAWAGLLVLALEGRQGQFASGFLRIVPVAGVREEVLFSAADSVVKVLGRGQGTEVGREPRQEPVSQVVGEEPCNAWCARTLAFG
ncbi:hypothetical protein SMALA_1511 [Streptomyces malaysiensis subsp. malaysiensis]|nr:hypothetical protein SMALA_1511 [Streptomyces malaysiensis]